MPVETAVRPWQMISCDIFTWEGNDYLVTVDHFSNFSELDKLKESSAKQVIKKMKKLMSRYGEIEVLISDSGPQFTSKRFSDFATNWHFEHRTSSPHHQQANGRAEAAVKSIKSTLRKAKAANEDPYKALLALRNTEQEGISSSPGQRFLGRRAKTSIPITECLLVPDSQHLTCNVAQQHKKLVDKAKYDRHAKDLPPLKAGDSVRIKPVALGDKVWIKGSVLQRLDERSYVVSDGRKVIRRNRRVLKPIPTENPSEAMNENTNPASLQPPDASVLESPTTDVATGSPAAASEPPVLTVFAASSYGRPLKRPSYLNDYVLYK